MVEYPAGPDHTIVVYEPPDLGTELDPRVLFAAIAADAEARAPSGQRILSMTSLPLRHAGTFFGQQGSGIETKAVVAVVYERFAVATG
jgi:hypothetical protein